MIDILFNITLVIALLALNAGIVILLIVLIRLIFQIIKED